MISSRKTLPSLYPGNVTEIDKMQKCNRVKNITLRIFYPYGHFVQSMKTNLFVL